MKKFLLSPKTQLLAVMLCILAVLSVVAQYTEYSVPPQKAAMPPDGQDPLIVVQYMLDELNQGHMDAAYNMLSSEAREEVSLKQVRLILEGLKVAGTRYFISINKIEKITVGGDHADAELTLKVEFGNEHALVKDEGALVKEDGKWRIADHFIQNALVAVGLMRPPEGTRKLNVNDCAVGDPVEGVFASSRLKVLDPCITVVGIVRNDIKHAVDGDITFGLYVSGDDRRLVNSVNDAHYDGSLHIEIVPFDQKNVPEPKPGDRVRITGAWVTDLPHGHNEIHPVFRLEVLSSPLPLPSPSPQLEP